MKLLQCYEREPGQWASENPLSLVRRSVLVAEDR